MCELSGGKETVKCTYFLDWNVIDQLFSKTYCLPFSPQFRHCDHRRHGTFSIAGHILSSNGIWIAKAFSWTKLVFTHIHRNAFSCVRVYSPRYWCFSMYAFKPREFTRNYWRGRVSGVPLANVCPDTSAPRGWGNDSGLLITTPNYVWLTKLQEPAGFIKREIWNFTLGPSWRHSHHTLVIQVTWLWPIVILVKCLIVLG